MQCNVYTYIILCCVAIHYIHNFTYTIISHSSYLRDSYTVFIIIIIYRIQYVFNMHLSMNGHDRGKEFCGIVVCVAFTASTLNCQICIYTHTHTHTYTKSCRCDRKHCLTWIKYTLIHSCENGQSTIVENHIQQAIEEIINNIGIKSNIDTRLAKKNSYCFFWHLNRNLFNVTWRRLLSWNPIIPSHIMLSMCLYSAESIHLCKRCVYSKLNSRDSFTHIHTQHRIETHSANQA